MIHNKQNPAASTKAYKLIPRILAFITNNDYVLLLKGSPTKPIWPSLYNGIGGHVEHGETIWEAALREIREETGIHKVKNLLLRGIITIEQDLSTGIILFVFTGTSTTRKVYPSIEGDLEWVKIQDIPSMPCVEDIPVLLGQVTQMAISDQPFHAHYRYNKYDQLQVTFQPSNPNNASNAQKPHPQQTT